MFINQLTGKQGIGCLVTLIIVILVISLVAVSSPNPITIYSSGDLWAKVVLSILLAMVFGTTANLLSWNAFKRMISRSAGQPADDIICPGCGLPLLAHISSHGMPIQCPVCKKWWHNGPACYNKDMPRQRILVATYPCPIDRASRSEDIWDNLEGLSK